MAKITASAIPFRFPAPYKLNGYSYNFETTLSSNPVVSQSESRLVLKGKVTTASNDPDDKGQFSTSANFDIRFRGLDSQGQAIVDLFVIDRKSGDQLLSIVDARISKSQAARLADKGNDR